MNITTRLPGWGCAQMAALVEYAQQFGCSPERCLRDTGLCFTKLSAQDPCMEQELQVIKNLLEDVPIPAFRLGLEIGKTCHIGNFGLMGQAVVSCVSFKDLFELVNSHFSGDFHFLKVAPKLKFNRIETTFTLTQQHGIAIDAFLLGRDLGGAMAYEETVLAGIPSFVKEVGFIGPELPGMKEVGEYYACPVNYHQDQNYLISKPNLIDLVLPLGNKFLSRILRSRLQEELRSSQPVLEYGPISQQLKQQFELSHFQITSRDQMAARLNMSGRTLSRHLQAEGTNWRDLSNTLRMHKAQALLRSTQIRNIEDIALQVGFSGASAFSVAFSRYVGKSPQAFRHEAGGQQIHRGQTDPNQQAMEQI